MAKVLLKLEYVIHIEDDELNDDDLKETEKLISPILNSMGEDVEVVKFEMEFIK